MNYFRIFIGMVFCSFISFHIFAQGSGVDKNTYIVQGQDARPAATPALINAQSGDMMGIAGILKYRSDLGEEGGMYMNEEWEPGPLLLADGSRIDDWLFRYNVRNQQMQFIDGTDTLAISKPSEIKSLTFDDKTFVVELFEKDNILSQGYFELLRNGDNKLLLRREITHHVIDQSNDDPSDDVFVHNNAYYIKMGDEPATSVLMNKKCYYYLFRDHKEEVKAFIKDNKIKCNSEEDLLRVLDYYESL